MRTVCVVAFIAAVAMTAGPSASARTTLAGGDEQTPLYQSWADEAAAFVPVPDLPVTVIQARCLLRDATWCMDRNPPARVWTGGNTFYLWEHPEEYDEGNRLGGRLAFLHELGHVFDLVARGPKGYRKAFARTLGRPFTRWSKRQWNLEEQFAMAYSFCAMYRHPGMPRSRGRFGGAMDTSRHRTSTNACASSSATPERMGGAGCCGCRVARSRVELRSRIGGRTQDDLSQGSG